MMNLDSRPRRLSKCRWRKHRDKWFTCAHISWTRWGNRFSWNGGEPGFLNTAGKLVSLTRWGNRFPLHGGESGFLYTVGKPVSLTRWGNRFPLHGGETGFLDTMGKPVSLTRWGTGGKCFGAWSLVLPLQAGDSVSLEIPVHHPENK